MSAKVFVDTNVLIYARDASETDKQARVALWMEKLWARRAGRLSCQVLQEFYVAVTVKLSPGLDKELAKQDVRTLCAWRPISTDVQVMARAWYLQNHMASSLAESLKTSWLEAMEPTFRALGASQSQILEMLHTFHQIVERLPDTVKDAMAMGLLPLTKMNAELNNLQTLLEEQRKQVQHLEKLTAQLPVALETLGSQLAEKISQILHIFPA